jgi:hypothetical protein
MSKNDREVKRRRYVVKLVSIDGIISWILPMLQCDRYRKYNRLRGTSPRGPELVRPVQLQNQPERQKTYKSGITFSCKDAELKYV